MRKLIYAMVACAVFCASAFGQSVNLFRIERSKNANIVQYDVNIVNGEISRDNPVESYWVLLAGDGSRQNINAFQRRAYGFRVSHNPDGHLTLR